MFVNCSNHASEFWGELQIHEAQKWGEIVDCPFPAVDPEYDEKMIQKLAEETVKCIIQKEPTAVMCQGEFTLTYAIVQQLKKMGILVVAACSERKSAEIWLPDGTVQKKTNFEFIRFRKY